MHRYSTEQLKPNQKIALYVYFKYLFFIWILKNPSLWRSLRTNSSSIGNKTRRRGIIYMYVFNS